MKQTAKKAAKNFFDRLGFKVVKIDRRQVSDADRFKWLQNIDIKTVIDIGGSKGNAALQFHSLFPGADIYSFEPLKDVFEQMNRKLGGVPQFKSFNIALSDTKGSSIIHRSSYSGSSSLREMANLHKEAFPMTSGGHVESIETDTLDNVLKQFSLEENILVKIDVQGSEDKVIRGGHTILKQAKVIIIETSFAELYTGQPLFGEIHQLLVEMGFKYVGAWEPDLKSPIDGASLQQDSIFLKK